MEDCFSSYNKEDKVKYRIFQIKNIVSQNMAWTECPYQEIQKNEKRSKNSVKIFAVIHGTIEKQDCKKTGICERRNSRLTEHRHL